MVFTFSMPMRQSKFSRKKLKEFLFVFAAYANYFAE